MRGLPATVRDPTFQFADDITNSTSALNVDQLRKQLEDNFDSIQSFCVERDLMVNTGKTQCIILKLPTKKIDTELELNLNNHTIKASSSVDLLGLTIDQHLSFKEHIERISKKCHGLLGVISKSRHILPLKLLKLTYTALVRPHLEYCSLITACASKTNRNKLDVVQKIASRIIFNEARDAHAAPLLQKLGLQSLDERRTLKILKTVDKILDNKCHPYLTNMFSLDNDGLVANNESFRTTFGKKRFSIYAKDLYNNFLSNHY